MVLHAPEPYHSLFYSQRDGTNPEAFHNAAVLGCFAVPSWTVIFIIWSSQRHSSSQNSEAKSEESCRLKTKVQAVWWKMQNDRAVRVTLAAQMDLEATEGPGTGGKGEASATASGAPQVVWTLNALRLCIDALPASDEHAKRTGRHWL